VAGFTPMAIAVASVSAPRDKVGIAIGRVQAAQLLSTAVGPAVGGVAATHLGIRPAFYVTSGMCAIALVALIVLFRESRPLEPGEGRPRPRSAPLAEFLRYPYFLVVIALLVIAQFIDRGLALLVPLQVAHMPGVEPALTSGIIIAVGAVGAAISASAGARLAEGVPVGRLLLGQLLAGGALCAAMALAHHWIVLLVLRTLVALCLGGALTLAYSLGGMLVPGETRGAAFGWLAMGVQIGTAASPLATGALAAASLPSAFVATGALAWAGAALLFFGARELLNRQR
jgi:MFS family permease